MEERGKGEGRTAADAGGQHKVSIKYGHRAR